MVPGREVVGHYIDRCIIELLSLYNYIYIRIDVFYTHRNLITRAKIYAGADASKSKYCMHSACARTDDCISIM